jgi:hypothetical protein
MNWQVVMFNDLCWRWLNASLAGEQEEARRLNTTLDHLKQVYPEHWQVALKALDREGEGETA